MDAFTEEDIFAFYVFTIYVIILSINLLPRILIDCNKYYKNFNYPPPWFKFCTS